MNIQREIKRIALTVKLPLVMKFNDYHGIEETAKLLNIFGKVNYKELDSNGGYYLGLFWEGQEPSEKEVETLILRAGIKPAKKTFGYIFVRREPNGRFKTDRFSNLDALRAAFKRLGFKETGVEDSPYVRPELRGQPRFKELLGPMWDGTNGVRYEDQATYDILST